MALNGLGAPPVLSTPDTHILNETVPVTGPADTRVSDGDLYTRYEIQRTLEEIRNHSWRKVALQFPDEMLVDSARVFELLTRGIRGFPRGSEESHDKREETITPCEQLSNHTSQLELDDAEIPVKLSILADTSYGSCCVDEIAAEHVDADTVVHYGRACLSPIARLPVTHIFTRQSLDCEQVVNSFKDAFSDKRMKIVLTADMPYDHHVQVIYQKIIEEGYEGVFAAEIIHAPASPIPNRTVPQEVRENPEKLKDWRLFHISEPPTSLLLTLASRLAEIRIYPKGSKTRNQSMTMSPAVNNSLLLRRRYALVTSLATVSIWGILINTLSVKNYLHILDLVKSQIAAAGKKSYMFVVGKLNAAKLANFSEIGGWVVIGCWESSLVDSKDFYKPVLTPFELELALRRDEDRVWNGEWSADFQRILDARSAKVDRASEKPFDESDGSDGDYDSEQESAPPEFDLRTGRYVSQTRPMQAASRVTTESSKSNDSPHSSALTRRANGDVVAVNGVASPAAQFLQSRRTWQGLGSDFEIGYEQEDTEGSAIQEGRSGIARGYAVGTQGSRT
ncbi:Diphthamide biosynthesis protein 2 [Endocarpon pusillum Z07020]|uniref:2-(3-amino-3-carboxypropyl)histidine synthase subunit 2 n=1 Tax=Endocarpon pusillum (strain Z07020 / HMAS-L-300199) TaxID=1263415 RepID=U1HRB9_ENDPU|nr:Diphthamide biosynthesis protein 2 [Endocarpon pusillum Z07020]ERF71644.1 Diphthamide biosynthesis protein 2 [Endocarpon pusillum Z07020]